MVNVLTYLYQREVVQGQLDPDSVVLFGGSKLKVINFGYGMHLIQDPIALQEFQK
jgi:hypothetical protein